MHPLSVFLIDLRVDPFLIGDIIVNDSALGILLNREEELSLLLLIFAFQLENAGPGREELQYFSLHLIPVLCGFPTLLSPRHLELKFRVNHRIILIEQIHQHDLKLSLHRLLLLGLLLDYHHSPVEGLDDPTLSQRQVNLRDEVSDNFLSTGIGPLVVNRPEERNATERDQ